MAPTSTKQWVTAQDGLDKLRLETVDLPQPPKDHVLVKINAVSLNFRDTEVAMGVYGHHKSVSQNNEPIVLCSDMCGTIVSPSSSGDWKAGMRVASIFNQTHLTGQITAADMSSGLGLPLQGVLAEYRYFPSKALVRVPDYLTDEEVACLPIAAVTAWMSINWQQPLHHPYIKSAPSPGESKTSDRFVLFQGTGGVSISGLLIAHAAGFKTIVTSSSDAKLEKAMTLGADYTINYRSTPDWSTKVMSITGERGADIIFENGGAQTLRQSFECVAFGGCISCIGYLSGKEDDAADRTTTNVLALKRNVTLKGMLNGPKDRFEEMLGFWEEHKIKPVIDRTFGFEEGREALEYLWSGSHFGKVVVKVVK
jgi:NADPH:quinone reductase-like Zn-dependent oxidoreductase